MQTPSKSGQDRRPREHPAQRLDGKHVGLAAASPGLGVRQALDRLAGDQDARALVQLAVRPDGPAEGDEVGLRDAGVPARAARVAEQAAQHLGVGRRGAGERDRVAGLIGPAQQVDDVAIEKLARADDDRAGLGRRQVRAVAIGLERREVVGLGQDPQRVAGGGRADPNLTRGPPYDQAVAARSAVERVATATRDQHVVPVLAEDEVRAGTPGRRSSPGPPFRRAGNSTAPLTRTVSSPSPASTSIWATGPKCPRR